ncbi:MAG: hypothetical protein FRX49_10149 [Trebouxia sp. A1-2]|nr:MAG: hypothetical protein FRX49_10149 [Trebouxia sp. A1-2]
MQHSSLHIERQALQLAPNSHGQPVRLPGRGLCQRIKCAAEEGLQIPKWPQQNFSRNLPCPQRLCSVSSKVPASDDKAIAAQTVYTIRMCTGSARGSGMTEQRAGVWLGLVGQDGSSYLHRAVPLSDPDVIEQELIQICQIANRETGANCKNVSLHRGKTVIKQRFQTGSIDEVCFLGPELGPLAGLMIGPEQGGWQVDEITVVSSRTGNVDRFLCRQRLGYRADKNAEYLMPVPLESVVYGSGETAVVLSKQSVDSIPSKLPRRTLVKRVPIADAIQRITGNPSLRFGFLTAMALTGIWAIQNWSPDSSGTATTQVAEVRQMMTGLLGFMMWKLAVVGVTTVPLPRRQHALDEIV